MSEVVGSIFIFVFIAILFVLLPLGLIKPAYFEKYFGQGVGRKRIAKYFGAAAFVSMVGGTLLVSSATSSSVGPQANESVRGESITVEPQQALDPVEPETSTETEVLKESVSYGSETVYSDQYDKDYSKITQEGENGERSVAYEITYSDGVEISRQEVSSEVTKDPLNEVITVGTRENTTTTVTQQPRTLAQTTNQPKPQPVQTPKPVPKKPAAPVPKSTNCDPNYSPCVPISATDLNCDDIKMFVRVIGPDDPHNFDHDSNGEGCVTYR